MRKLMCYGDSNTYGYDPRAYLGDRYPVEHIWTTLLADWLGPEWVVVNRGRNGREIPHSAQEYRYAETLLEDLTDQDILLVMLGSNDIFLRSRPDADIPIRRMEELLLWLTKRPHRPQILLIAPPFPGSEAIYGPQDQAADPDPALRPYIRESARMNAGFQKLSEKYPVFFADAALWGIEPAFDHVHFTETGHRRFAEELKIRIEKLPKSRRPQL